MIPLHDSTGLDGGTAGECAASLPSGYTPASNRGVGIRSDLCVSPHWLAATVHDSLSVAIEAYFECFLDISGLTWSEISVTWFRPLERSARGYSGAWECRDGMQIYAYPATSNHCHLVMSGSVLEKYSVDQVTKFLLTFIDQDEVDEHLAGGPRPRLNVTRFDLAIDNCPFTPRQVFEALDNGNFRSKARPGAWIPDTGTGSTAYHGSRKSDKQMRVYDRRGPTRLEIQYRRKAALALCCSLCYLDHHEWVDHTIGVVRDFIDFVERKKNVTDSPLLPWWNDLIGSTGRIRLPSGYREPDSIARLRGFVARVAPSVKALLYFEKQTADQFFESVDLGDRQLQLLRSVGRGECLGDDE